MKVFDENRLKVLGALFVDYHRPDLRFVENADLSREYNLHMSDSLFGAVVANSKSCLQLAESKDGIGAKLTPEGYGIVLSELLDWVDGSTIEVNWKKEEILSDARHLERLPGLRGWKLFTFESSDSQKPADRAEQQRQIAEAVDSSTHVFPIPPKAGFWNDINWAKSAAIAAWIIIPVSVVGIIVTIWLDKN